MITLYIIGPKGNGDGSYYLVNKDGYCLAGHWCSHVGFSESDLIEGRPERKEKWKYYLAGGYKLEHIDDGSEKANELFALNKNFFDESRRLEYEATILLIKNDATQTLSNGNSEEGIPDSLEV